VKDSLNQERDKVASHEAQHWLLTSQGEELAAAQGKIEKQVALNLVFKLQSNLV